MGKMKLTALLLSLALLGGCAAGGAGDANTPVPENPGTPVIQPTAAPALSIGQAVNEFGVRLLQEVRQEGEGALVSPLSVLLALSMTANGAAGETQDAFLSLLGGGGVSLETLNADCAALMARYAALGGSTVSKIANGLWADQELEVNPEFLQRCTDVYGAGARQTDLDTRETVKEVNSWVKEQTSGMIDGILSDPPSADARLLLVNALYLKNTWAYPFDPVDTWDLSFHPAEGKVQEGPFLGNGIRSERYLSTGEETGVVLPYDDGRLAFLAVMPETGSLTDYLDGWDAGRLNRLLAGAEETRLLLRMPKFEAEWGGSLNGALCQLGLGRAFDPALADFSAMGTADGPLYIGSVMHKTRIEVNEEGTEAAAVTSVIVDCASVAVEPDYETLVLERPFVYAIVDLDLGIPLFLGTFEGF